MSDIYQIASAGMFEGKQRLEAISLNAASASLPGYRRHVVTGRAFDAALAMSGTEAGPNAAASRTTAATTPIPQLVDLQRGAMISTGRALDVAIDSDDGFFALTDGTKVWLTRAGSFRINAEGLLSGEGGLRVVGVQGDVHLPGSDVEVGADGRIMHAGVVLGTLQLYRPDDQASLVAAHGSLLETAGGVTPFESGTARMRGATLEASNTDAGREMLSLMSLSRQFEGLSHVVQSYDELLGRVIQKLGEV